MKLITAVTQPGTFEAMKAALSLFGVRGMTVSQVVRATGRTPPVQIYRGLKFAVDLQPSLRIELLAPDNEVPDLVQIINKIISTSEPDDGTVWITPVDLVVRVRTRQYGVDAL
ncbi:MAG: P-II family nitrogen regulator [Pseudonocardia sp.]|nr:P-II family nitrogen regulator [Pseudonocardia sp.]